MDQYHDSTAFLKFDGQRFSARGSALLQSPAIHVAHDKAVKDRDAVLQALIDTQQRLQAALETIRVQDRTIASLESPSSQVNIGRQQEDKLEWVGFRLITSGTGTYFHDLGFQSRGRSTDPSQSNIWKREMFIEHVKGIHTSPLTEYISVSDSPGRILNQPASTARDYEVAVIDLKRLRHLGQVLERTSDVQQMLAIKEHIDYVTSSHILIYSSIPRSCILGFLSKIEFETLCVTKGILSLNTASHDQSPGPALRSIDVDTKLRRSEMSLRSNSRWASPLYYRLPTRPPLRRYKFLLTLSKGQTIRRREEHDIDPIESQMQLLSVTGAGSEPLDRAKRLLGEAMNIGFLVHIP